MRLTLTMASMEAEITGRAVRKGRARAQLPLSPAVIELVDGLVKSLPPYDYQRPAAYGAALAAICRALEAKGAAWSQAGDLVSFRFAAIRSTATSGRHMALKNWLVAARRRLDAHQAVRR